MENVKSILIAVVGILILNSCENEEKGTFGVLEWKFDGVVLTISGKGEMSTFTLHDPPPWEAWKKEIKTIIIQEGVTTIGGFAFEECEELISVAIPKSVTTIEGNAFLNCIKLKTVSIPKSVTKIGIGVFKGCTELNIIPESFWKTSYSPLRLDGWYKDCYCINVNEDYATFSFTFRDKYNERGINDCVQIDADGKRIYPDKQEGDYYVFDFNGVEKIEIRSIHPGKPYVPFSQEIELKNAMFHRESLQK